MGSDLWVPGPPAKKGSVRPIKTKSGHIFVKPMDDKLVSWTGRVAALALAAGWKPLEGPVLVALSFYLPRPMKHFVAGDPAKGLRGDAPAYPIGHQAGDLDKFIRAALDALTGIAYRDDAQVIAFDPPPWKRYADGINAVGTRIVVWDAVTAAGVGHAR